MENKLNDKLELSGFFRQIQGKWPWLLLFLALGMGSGYLLAKYKKQIYNAKASIKIDETESSVSQFLAIDMFEDGFSSYNKISTEAKIVGSRTMVEQALSKLPLDIRYYKHGTFSSFELYRKSPIQLNILSDGTSNEPLELEVNFKDQEKFNLSYSLKNKNVDQELSLGEIFEINGKSYSIESNYNQKKREIDTEGSYRIKVVDKKKLAQEFKQNLIVLQTEDKVSILNIAYQSTNPHLAKEFVEALVTTYVDLEYDQKSLAASNTIRFIDERLEQISLAMNEVEDKITQFKQDKKIIDFEAVERLETEKVIDIESKKRIAELRLLNLQIVENELNQGKQLTDISINAEGNMDPTLNQLITFFNDLKIKKATLGVNFTEDGKKSRELDSKILETINSIRESIQLSKSTVEQEIEYLDSKIDLLNRRYNVFPQNQKDYFHLIRDFEVNQKVVSFLMEKKIEASIANASLISDVQIIDMPLLPDEPVSISSRLVFILCTLFSLFFGASIIIVSVFLNNRIYDKWTLESNTDIPVLGSLTVSQSKEFESLSEIVGTERTIFKESINSLRTNLRFLPESKNARIVSVTSTVSQEGKSFTLINLATSLTLLDKSVVVIDLDMRKPKIQKYFNQDNMKTGASLFLSGKANLDGVIHSSHIANLDYILSGPIPPNPMELIQSDKFSEMLSMLKERYDYVMIDNPPIGIVSDAINVMMHSDLNLFVVRAGFSRLNFLETAINVKEKNQIKNLYFVLNGAKRTGSGYYRNYSQGYYTGEKKSVLGAIKKV